MLGQLTTMLAVALSEPSLVVVTLAVFGMVVQEAEVVGEVMWTWLLAPDARSAGPKLRTPPLMLHPLDELAASIVQLVPAVVGSVSLTVTPCAVPAPVLLTVTTKPMVSPALTVPASATLVMWMLAQLTVVSAEADTSALLVAWAVATLWYVAPQLAAVVELVTCTLKLAPGAMSPMVQLSVCVGGTPLI